MSRSLKTRGKKTFKRRKKHITLKKKGKSRRKRNIKSRKKRNNSRRNEARGSDVRSRRNNFLNAYKWYDRDIIVKGYIHKVDGDFVYIKTQMGENGPFEILTFEPREFLALEKAQLNSDKTKKLKEDAEKWDVLHSLTAVHDRYDDELESTFGENDSDDDTASTRGFLEDLDWGSDIETEY